MSFEFEPRVMRDCRCKTCDSWLCRSDGNVEIKCKKCKTFNVIKYTTLPVAKDGKKASQFIRAEVVRKRVSGNNDPSI